MRLSEQHALTLLPALEAGERLLAAYRPGARWFLARYLVSLGGYEAWRRRTVYAVTDRRVMLASGRVGRDCHSVAVSALRDLDLRHRPWGSRVIVGTAAAERVGELVFNALGQAEASELWRAIGQAQRTASGAEASVAAQLAELSRLREAGFLTEAEVAAAKLRTLGAAAPSPQPPAPTAAPAEAAPPAPELSAPEPSATEPSAAPAVPAPTGRGRSHRRAKAKAAKTEARLDAEAEAQAKV